MYVRTIQRRNKDGSVVRYLQLAHNVREPGKRHPVAKVIHSFGREDELDRAALARLVRSISRFVEPAEELAATAAGELRFLGSGPLGGAYVLDRLWRRLGIDEAILRLARRRRVTPAVERLLFALVCQRALAPASKRAALEWAREELYLPGIAGLGSAPQVFYRAMDFLLDCDEEIQRQVFLSVATVLDLEVDLILFDTILTPFEPEEEDDSRMFGRFKECHDDRPQAMVALAMTKKGIPVRRWVSSGDASRKVLIGRVEDDLRAWKLHRVVRVCDRDLACEENRVHLQPTGGHYILGEKLPQGHVEMLARPGRYHKVGGSAEVKDVWVGDGERRRRFVVCRNLEEQARSRARRGKALARLEDELAALARERGEVRERAEAELLTHPTLGRYLSRRRGRLEIDRGKVRAEERLDGKYLLSSSDDSLSATEIASFYNQVKEVERAWRDQKHVLDLRLIHHRRDDQVRSHFLLSLLALLLVRVAEVEAKDTWPTIRRELQRMHLGEFEGSAGRVLQRTKTTPAQRHIFKALAIEEPPRFFAIEPPGRP